MNDMYVVALITSAPAFLAALYSWKNGKKLSKAEKQVVELAISIDGRMEEYVEKVRLAARAEGVSDERQVGAERAADVEVARAEITAAEAIRTESAAEARTPTTEIPEVLLPDVRVTDVTDEALKKIGDASKKEPLEILSDLLGTEDVRVIRKS